MKKIIIPTAFLAMSLSIALLSGSCKKEAQPETKTNTVTNTVYANLEQGLLFNYDFTGSILDGSNLANDLDATNSTNYSFTSDRNGKANKAISFSGNGKLVLPNNSSFKVQFPFTVSFWTNVADSSDFNNRFICSDASAVYNGFYIQTNFGSTGLLACSYGDGGCSGSNCRLTAYSSVPLRSNTWQHVAVIYKSATEMVIYMNGVKDNNVTYDGTATSMVYTSMPGEIGHLAGNPGYFMNGKMDKIRMWSRELSADEVQAEYSSTF